MKSYQPTLVGGLTNENSPQCNYELFYGFLRGSYFVFEWVVGVRRVNEMYRRIVNPKSDANLDIDEICSI